jgi:uncharacterized protein (TIGR02246 family)
VTAVRAKLDVATCETVIAGAMRAWINGDSVDFASHFTEDADLVNIHGMHLRGRQAIAGFYDMLFRSVLAGCRLTFEGSTRRQLRADMVLVHLRVAVKQCRGYLAGDHHTVSSVVLSRGVRGWAIASLHNTMVGSACGGGG